jgi:FAD/FMN-containing dehydrogenase
LRNVNVAMLPLGSVGAVAADVDVVGALRAIVGEAHVLTEADVVAGYEVDWTGRFRGRTPAVVRPADTRDVAAVVQWCAAAGVALVAQGGNTGLVGGGVPLGGEVVLSLRRLDDLGEVDVTAGQVTVGAGATLEAVQRHVAAAGLDLAVDLAARGSATIGGMVATNAGGTRVLRHGPMRAQVVGVEAVLGTGAVISHLGGLLKDNTGYDLAGLLCGSEGTLGVVTAVRLRLVPPAAARVTALLALATAADAVAAFVAARAGCASLDGAELVFADGVELVCDHLGIAPPFPGAPTGAYLLLEAAAAADPTDELVGALAPVADRIADTAIATTSTRREDLWRYREAHTEAINALGVPHKLDVTLPLGRLAAFCDEVRAVVADRAPAARTFLFGHVGDGNVHVNVVGAGEGDEVDDAVLRLVAARGGSISAEHGIGTAKRRHLHLSRSPDEIAAFRAIKRALDPAGILNPRALLPGEE